MTETEQETASTAAEAVSRSASRFVLRGILPGDSNQYVLSGREGLIGRSDFCQVRIDRNRVSRRHAEFRREGPVLALRDLSSRNGTFVDGRRIEHCALEAGMVLRIGDWLGICAITADSKVPGFGELAPGLFGGSGLGRVLAPVRAVAPLDLPVVIVGPTGVGKERFADAVHRLSGRKAPLYAINCAALPSALADAELFGYRKGAFTGAERNHDGHLRAAGQGTLLLDELPELPLELQAKLLRVIEQRVLLPVGETRAVRFEARLVATAQRPLADLVDAGTLREDLAARLSGLTVTVPSLRERREDVPSLFHQFLTRYSGGRPPSVATAVYERLCLQEWRGNVRQLELLARELVAVHGRELLLRCSHLPEAYRAARVAADRVDMPRVDATTRSEHDLAQLRSALNRTQGNMKRAASLAGISRQRAYRLLRADAADEPSDSE